MVRPSSLRCLALAVLAACTTPHVTRPDGPSGSEGGSRGGAGAFVVVSASETLVIPVDPAAPLVRAGGLWLLDETDGTVVRPSPTPASRGRRVCRAEGSASACTLETFVRLRETLDATLDPDCSCFVDEATQRCDDDPFAILGYDAWAESTDITFERLLEARYAAEHGDDGDGEYGGNEYLEEDDEEGCDESGATPVSLHGGTLYSEVYEHNGCMGLNLYGTSSLATELTADARAFTLRDADEVACDPEGAFVDGWATRSEEDRYLCRGGRWYVPEEELDEADEDDALDRCDGHSSPDGEVVFHQGRYLLVVGADTDGTGSGARFSARLRLGRETCTSADPCGSPEGFVAYEGFEPDAPELGHLFVATDGTAALEQVSGRLHVVRRNDERPSRTVPYTDEILGVRFHADARRLLRAIELESRHEATSDAGEGECEAGFEVVDEACRVRCSVDADCRGSLGCEAVCIAGLCDEEGVDCNAAHPCGVDSTCREGRCALLELAEADEDFEDPRGGTGWGNRCIVHLRAGRLDAAQAACAAGLEVAERPATRAALLYNLGLVAERRGDRTSARLDYEASLLLRPNPTVERALAALGGPIER